jgi:glutaredoxin 3
MANTLWTKVGCPYCDELRRELRAHAIEVEEIDIGKSPHLVPELLKITGRRRIVPVLVRGTRIEIAPRGGSKF